MKPKISFKSNLSAEAGSFFGKIAKDATFTLVSEVIVLIFFFVFYRLLGNQFRVEAVGIYSVIRRILAMAIPIVMLGLAEALGHYIAAAKNEIQKANIISAGLTILLTVLAAVNFSINYNPELSATLIFGAGSYSVFIYPFSIFLIGISFHTFVYSCLRGALKIKALNLFQITNLGFLPIIILLAKHDDFGSVLALIGAMQSIIASFTLVYLLRKLRISINKPKISVIKTLLIFGAPRVPAPLASAALISVITIMGAHYLPMSDVGYLSIAMALLVGLGGGISPLGAILLPHVSGLAGKGKLDVFGKNVHILIGATIQCLIFISCQSIVFADHILMLWMGREFLPAVTITRIILLSLLPYGFFVMARNVLDAVTVRPINSINSIISLLVLIISLFLIIYIIPIKTIDLAFSIAFTISYLLLGLLTYRAIRKIFPDENNIDGHYLKWGGILNIPLTAVSLFAKPYMEGDFAIWIFFEVILIISYIFFLKLLRFEWAANLLGKLKNARQ